LEYWHIQEKAPAERGNAGQIVELGYRFYPSALPLRIQVVDVFSKFQKSRMPSGFCNLEKWQKHQTSRIVENPWLSTQPAVLEKVAISNQNNHPVLKDTEENKHLYFTDLKSAIQCSVFASGGTFSLFGHGHAGHFEVESIFCRGVPMAVETELQSIKP
jgi:hypothetical protein